MTKQKIINDFSINVATVNGFGSQTSNMVLQRAMFKMGIPTSGKNTFPTNIQGMPAWYVLRVSKDGYEARHHRVHIVVLMNGKTAVKDHLEAEPNSVCLYADDLPLDLNRADLIYYPMPVKKLSRAKTIPRGLRDRVANMVYVGIVAQLLGIDLDAIHNALIWRFNGREKPATLNMNVVQSAHDWATQNLAKRDPYRVEAIEGGTDGYLMMDGNAAAGLGAIYGGMSVTAWYPITPSTSVIDAMREYAAELRCDEDGKNNYAVVQAEDEIAAIGMTLGAGWAGARAMTATSGAGVSLMTELLGLGYYAEVPAVIWNVQRMGPSTGLPTRTAQGDLFSSYWASHGDTQFICLLPGSVAECFEFGWRAFDLAEQFQTPLFVLSDLDLGMNQWMTKPFAYPDEPMNRGKVLTAAEVAEKGFQRYADVDGDGICYRTLPGNSNPQAAYYARGSGHTIDAKFTEDPQIWTENSARLDRKFELASHHVPQPIIEQDDEAQIGIIAYGSTTPAVQEARDRLAEKGIRSSYLRLRALPLNHKVQDFVAQHDRVYVVEQNSAGQLHKIIQIKTPEMASRVHSAALSDGWPLTAQWIVNELRGPFSTVRKD